jgi:hypothetical protein
MDDSSGRLWVVPNVSAMLTPMTPAGSSLCAAAPAICSSSRLPLMSCRKRSPASVNVSLRVLR